MCYHHILFLKLHVYIIIHIFIVTHIIIVIHMFQSKTKSKICVTSNLEEKILTTGLSHATVQTNTAATNHTVKLKQIAISDNVLERGPCLTIHQLKRQL